MTTLGDRDTPEDVRALCARAQAPPGPVAAVCVWPRFAADAVRALAGTGIPVAGVANFLAGDLDRMRTRDDLRTIIEIGGTEVDLVWPYRTWLAGNHRDALALVTYCREQIDDRALLKVILETGELGDEATIGAVSRALIDAGAQFLKTSSGKVAVNATLPAARAMLDAIAETGGTTGFKAAGGIRTQGDAAAYAELAAERLGDEWVSARHFRLGASSLLDALKQA